MLLSGYWLAAPSPSVSSAKLLESLLETVREQLGLLILLFLVTEVLAILAGWAASKALVKNTVNGTLLKSLHVQLLYLLAGFLAGIIAFAALKITDSVNAASFSLLVFGGTMVFAVPMKVYEIDFTRALGWLLLTFVYNFVGTIGVSLVLGETLKPITDKLAAVQGSPARKKSVDELEADFRRDPRPTAAPAADRPTVDARPAADRTAPPGTPRAGTDGRFEAQEKIAGDKARTQPERMAAITELYKLLEQERVGLPPGDAAARTAFDQRRARYEAILQRLRAEPTPRPKK